MIETTGDIEAYLDAFGEQVEIGGAVELAIWGSPYLEVPSDVSSVASSDSSAMVPHSVGARVSIGDALVRGGVPYRIAIIEPDGVEGFTTLTLEKVAI